MSKDDKKNPFARSMAKLYLPAHMGQSISVAGFELTADEDGAVEVPKEHVPTLLAHGLRDSPPEAPPAPAPLNLQGRGR